MTMHSIRMLVDEIGLTFIRYGPHVLGTELTPVWRLGESRAAAAGMRAGTIVNRDEVPEEANAADALGPESRRLLEPATFAMHLRNFAHELQAAEGADRMLFVELHADGGDFSSVARAEAAGEGIDPARVVVELKAGSEGFGPATAAVARAGFRLSVTGLGPTDAAAAAVSASRPAIVRFNRDWLLEAIANTRAAPLLPPLFHSIRAAGMEPHVAGIATAEQLRALAGLGSMLVEGPALREVGDLEAAQKDAARADGSARRRGMPGNVVSIRR